jgi:8-oxo-dGTP pyrophosphatase MutT (NUDIX family)
MGLDEVVRLARRLAAAEREEAVRRAVAGVPCGGLNDPPSGAGCEVGRAAGGLIVRAGRQATDVVLVHRPAFDDWSFPKGSSSQGGRTRGRGAEVEEETGLVCLFGADLGAITYVDGRGRPKVVRYWEMTAPEGRAARGPRDR